MPVAAPGQTVLGLILEDLSPGSRSHASWGQVSTRLVEDFMTNDPAFLDWVTKRSRRDSRFKVTETSLQDFPLEGIRKLLGASKLDSVTNRHGGLVKPLIDSRIIRKMAKVYKGMNSTVPAKASLPPATVAVNHYYQFAESKHPTPEPRPEKAPARRRRPQPSQRVTLKDLYLSHGESQSDGDRDEVNDEEEELVHLLREEKIAQRKKAKLVDEFFKLEGVGGDTEEEIEEEY